MHDSYKIFFFTSNAGTTKMSKIYLHVQYRYSHTYTNSHMTLDTFEKLDHYVAFGKREINCNCIRNCVAILI